MRPPLTLTVWCPMAARPALAAALAPLAGALTPVIHTHLPDRADLDRAASDTAGRAGQEGRARRTASLILYETPAEMAARHVAGGAALIEALAGWRDMARGLLDLAQAQDVTLSASGALLAHPGAWRRAIAQHYGLKDAGLDIGPAHAGDPGDAAAMPQDAFCLVVAGAVLADADTAGTLHELAEASLPVAGTDTDTALQHIAVSPRILTRMAQDRPGAGSRTELGMKAGGGATSAAVTDSHARDDMAALAADIRERDAQMVNLLHVLQAERGIVAALLGSTSWRVTAPLRGLRRRLRRLRPQ